MQLFDDVLKTGPPDIWDSTGFRNALAEKPIPEIAIEILRKQGLP
jgi:hypothetical protein